MQAVESLKICTMIGSFCSKHINFYIKKYRRVMFHDTEEWCKIWKKKLTLGSKNDMRNLEDFNGSSGKSENLHFDVLLSSIAYKDSTKKVQKSCLSLHWRVIQTLKKNSFFVWKMTWELWWILTWAVKNLKICTLMGYFCQKYVLFELK